MSFGSGGTGTCRVFNESQINQVFQSGSGTGPKCDCVSMALLELARGVIVTLDARDPTVDSNVSSEFDALNLRPISFLSYSDYRATNTGVWKAGDWVEFSNNSNYPNVQSGMWAAEQTIMVGADSYYGWSRGGGTTHTVAGWRDELLTAYNTGLWWWNQITIAQIPQPVDAGFVNVPKLAMEIFNLRTKQGSYSP